MVWRYNGLITSATIHPNADFIETKGLFMASQPMELWAFLENSDFLRRKADGLYRQDEVKLIRHDEFLETDYQLMVDIGCVGIRDAARWYVSHPKPHTFDWTWMDRVVK